MSHPRKRIFVDKPGHYGVFRYDETLINDPQPGEVQVEVKSCGINFADVSVRLGLYRAAKGSYPLCPGLEFAGVVRKSGPGVEGYKPGDKVFGACRFGGYTTAINSPAEHLWPLPEAWNFEKGATFPVAYLTAYYALHHVGHLKESDRVLIHSAAGGVGTALLHLLKLNGNMSVGVQDLWKKAEELSPEGYDLILDANGASTLKNSYRHLKPAGRLLIYGFASMFSHSGRKNTLKLIWYYLRTPRFNPFDLTGANKTISGFNLIYLFDKVDLFRKIMETLLSWESEGPLPSTPITTFPFEDVVSAHQAIESGRSIGKLVLVI
jgi:NADPH:quinone reductase-like Zn-dependent oxidoreductase